MSHDGAPLPLIRALRGAGEKRAGFALFRAAMLGLPSIGHTDPEAETRYLEGGSFLGAFEGETLRAVTNGYASEITLPGGAQAKHLSVTHVGTAAAANRRGFARGLLMRQLHEARAAGYALAGLRASDPRIYGRYGYGIASWSVSHDLDLTRSRPAGPAPDLALREVDPLADLPLLRRIEDATPYPRAARLRRWDGWWEMQAFRLRHAPGPFHAVVAGPPGAERGFLRFHTEAEGHWFTARERRVIIDDLIAHDDEAWRALIHTLFARDILHRAIFPARPLDDPLPLMLDNPRALQISGQRDESWLRILDPEAVLALIPWRPGPAALIRVSDPVIRENNRVFRIGEGEGYEIGISIADLASWIFGAAKAADLRAAGRLAPNPVSAGLLDSLHPGGAAAHSGISF